jgi:tetraacyldisaccharide 4'-kinase
LLKNGLRCSFITNERRLKPAATFFHVEKVWYKKSWLSFLLLPFAFFYYLVIILRKFLYRVGLKKSHSVGAPVIVVGNITVGGTGKTPMVIWLVEYFRSLGKTPGVISRGYKGSANKIPTLVDEKSDVTEIGDEPLLIYQRTKCPVVICRDRVAAAKKLLEVSKCDIIISDDGLQHYALKRDFEITVVDGKRMFGNGFLLPAGPLREPVSRLNSVDMVVINNSVSCLSNRASNMDSRLRENDTEIKLTSVPIYHAALQPTTVVNIVDPLFTKTLADFANQTVHAIAAIGNPQRFFEMLNNYSIKTINHAFPDHHAFKADEITFGDDLPILMTEKDAVKCKQFAKPNHWFVQVEMLFNEDVAADFSLRNLF